MLESTAAISHQISRRGADDPIEACGGPLRVHTHCNTGSLACLGWGTARSFAPCTPTARSAGPSALLSKRRGKPSNRSYPSVVRTEALALIKANYADFGPTLAAENWPSVTNCDWASKPSGAGCWPRDLGTPWSVKPVHQPRHRRERVGELVQIDGSRHYWFENRGPECTLIAYIDDATSRIQHAAFVPSELTLDYMRETQSYIERHGRPIAFYSDKHAIFRVNNREAAGGDGMTQFGRALNELNIDIICANSPQAKGRVERSILTFQDRLVKELRLAGISTMAAGNVFLPASSRNKRPLRQAAAFRRGRSPAARRGAHLRTCSPGRKSARSRTI